MSYKECLSLYDFIRLECLKSAPGIRELMISQIPVRNNVCIIMKIDTITSGYARKKRRNKSRCDLCDFQEIADPLMDLKQGMETLRVNKTFRGILSTLLSIGIFLNGNEVGIECQPNDIRLIRLSRNLADS